MGWATSAIRKINRNVLRGRCRGTVLVTHRLQSGVLLGTYSYNLTCLRLRSTTEDGMALTSAPVSTRKRRPVVMLVTKNKRLTLARVPLAASRGAMRSFPENYRVRCTFALRYRRYGGTSTRLAVMMTASDCARKSNHATKSAGVD